MNTTIHFSCVNEQRWTQVSTIENNNPKNINQELPNNESIDLPVPDGRSQEDLSITR